MKPALLVIDLQRAMCSGEYAMADIDAVTDRINTLAEQARAAGAPVVLIQHEEPEGPLRFDAEDWQLSERFAAGPDDLRVRKTTPDSFHRTDLQRVLKERGVDRLVLCGLQSDFCVDSTARSALAHGYPVVLAADAHATMDNGVLSAAQIVAHHNATLANMSSFGPRVAVKPAAEIGFTG